MLYLNDKDRMDWLGNLFFGNGIAHTMFVLSLVIAVGVLLGKVRMFCAEWLPYGHKKRADLNLRKNYVERR